MDSGTNGDHRPSFEGVKTNWRGFDRYDFLLDEQTLNVRPATTEEGCVDTEATSGQQRCLVIAPVEAAPGNPWTWRGCYFDHEPQFEIELLKRGYHVAFIQSDPGETWDAWYSFLTEDHGLSLKPAFSGMSKGGYNAFAWGTAHPDKVSCIYIDNTAISPESLMRLGELAQYDVPLLQVCGSLDPLLPNHAQAIERIYQEWGGRVSMMIKEGHGHHPHGLKDTRPIVEFIEKSFQSTPREPPTAVGSAYTKRAFYGIESQYMDFPSEGTYLTCRGPEFTECYDRYEFRIDGVDGSITLFAPEATAPGTPWGFSADSVDRNDAVDLALLARGFHVVVGPVPYNADGPVMEHWNRVYRHCVERGFSPRPVLEGAGAAAGEAYAWAIENPGRVSCIYAENPVLRSHMSNRPLLDRLEILVQAGVPILHVCGELDPWLHDHTRALQMRYRELGGTVTVLIREGEGHDLSGLKDTGPALDFITQCVR